MKHILKPITIALLVFSVLTLQSLGKTELDLHLDTKSIERDQKFLPHSYASMLSRATPSVVSVYTARIVKVANSRGYSPEE